MLLRKAFAISSLFLLSLTLPAPAKAASSFSYSVTVSDPSAALGRKKSAFLANLDGAIAQWKKNLVMKGNLKILVQITSVPTGLEGASASNIFRFYSNSVPVYEESAAYTIRTGLNVNASAYDLIINADPGFLANVAWYDPHPLQRTDPVPSNRVDLVSLLTHELGHAFGINGFINQTTLSFVGYMSLFDTMIAVSGGQPVFTGPSAVVAYGGPLPLTPGDVYHYGTASTPELIYDLMNGVNFYYGTRYWVGPLERAMMKDMGQSLR